MSSRSQLQVQLRAFGKVLLFTIGVILFASTVTLTYAFTDVEITDTGYTTYDCYSCSDAVADDEGTIYAIGSNSDSTSTVLYIYPADGTPSRTIEFPSITADDTFYGRRAIAVDDSYIYVTGSTKVSPVYHVALYIFPLSASSLTDGTLWDLESIWTNNNLTSRFNIWGVLVDADRIYLSTPWSATPTLMVLSKSADPLLTAPTFLTKASLSTSLYDPTSFEAILNPPQPAGMRFANDGTNRIFIGTGPTNAAIVLTLSTGALTTDTMVYGEDYSCVLFNYPAEVSPYSGNSVTSDANGNVYAVQSNPYIYSMSSDESALNRYAIDGASDIYSIFLKQTANSGDFLSVYVVDRVSNVVIRIDSFVSGNQVASRPRLEDVARDNGSGSGDPQFHGFAGQSFQVHGVDGSVYSIISDSLLQLNARFDYLSKGVCPSHSDGTSCWSHPGSYFGALTFQTNNGDRLQIAAGAATTGFESINFNGEDLLISASDSALYVTGREGDDQMNINLQDKYHMLVNAGIFSFKIENSDKFLNILSVAVQNRTRLTQEVRSHGILGQTWRVLKGNRRGRQVPEIEGIVEDYANSNNDEWGHDSTFNKFNLEF